MPFRLTKMLANRALMWRKGIFYACFVDDYKLWRELSVKMVVISVFCL